MSDASRRSVLGVLASCLVHAAIVLGMQPNRRASEGIPVEPLWMELQVKPPLQRAPALPAVPTVVPAAQPERPPLRERPRSARLSQPSVAPLQVAAEPGVVVDTSETTAAPASGQQAKLDLSPLAAARTLGDSTQFPLRDAGVSIRDDVPLSHTAQADALAQGVPGLHTSKVSGRSVEGVVVDAVEDTLYNVLRPWKLLQRTMLGSQYRYTGGGFDAAILPDGRVRFRDKDGLALTVLVTQTRETGPGMTLPPAPGGGLSLREPRALWQRLRGKDPFAAERRLFLERTRALREHLAGRAAERGTPSDDENRDVEAEPQLEPPASP